MIIDSLQAYATANPVIGGVVGIWGLGVATFLCRSIPAHLWALVTTHLTTSLYFDNSENGESELNFLSFMQWYESHGYSKWSRTMALDGASRRRHGIDALLDGDKKKIAMHCSIGDGFHFFFRNYKLFWLYRKKIEKTGIAKNLYSVSLHYFGRNKQIMYELISEFAYVADEDKIGVYTFDEWDWNSQERISPRQLSTVILKQELKRDILAMLDEFMVSREWYEKRGMAYKKTVILHGIPGTGKTSLIKALADHYNRNLCILNLNILNDKTLMRSLSQVPENSFVVIEDCDSAVATKTREGDQAPLDSIRPLTLSGLLNGLDGLIGLNDVIIFATTNYLERLDSALIRKGRVDHIWALQELGDAEIREYISLMFPDDKLPKRKFKEIVGCDLQGIYFEHKNDFSGFLRELK